MQQQVDQVILRAREKMAANASVPPYESESRRYSLLDLNKHYYCLSEFLCQDSREFLHRAYTALLKRAPDPAGLTAGLARLGSGGSVIDELWRILSSSEGRRVGVGIDGLQDPTQASYSISDFMREDPRESMYLAYSLLLKRNPDPVALSAGLARLEEGHSTISELWRITQSEEGQRMGVQVEGLIDPERQSYTIANFVIKDPISFVYLAYAAILKRNPDRSELLSGMGCLKRGGPMIYELWRLTQSLEARRTAVGVRNLLDPMRSSYSISELQGEDPVEHVFLIYTALLKRDPDSTGYTNYVAQLKEGKSVTSVIWRISRSEEGRRLGVQVRNILFFHLLNTACQRMKSSK